MKGNVTVLGIDVAKQKIDVALLKEENKHQAGSFGNTPRGHQKLWQWLKKNKATDCFACLEATGPYGEKLASLLHEKNVKVSVVNPARVKGFFTPQSSHCVRYFAGAPNSDKAS
ncbi:MAG: transposase [Myxococcota bacterium]